MLSDPQERAWYDSHRESILRGGDHNEQDHYEHNVKVTTSDELTSLIGKFSSNIPLTDAPNGFFGFLSQTFETLSNEEDAACDWEGLGPIDWPDFGKADDDYETVVKPFYAMWSGFSTKKTFSWKDLYNYAEAPDRRVRRLMEKENKRLRDEAIREFNDTVRSLVSFVRKRDPRYIPNTQSEADRQKILRDAAAAQAARSRAAHQALIDEQDVPEWARTTTQEEQVGSFSDEEEEVVDHYECVVCNKTFKSDKQYDAHEKSKKHIKAVQQLKREMQRENKHLSLDDEHEASMPTSVASISVAPSEHDSSEDSPDSDGLSSAGNVDATAEERVAPEPELVQVLSESEDDDYASRGEVEDRLGALGSGLNPVDGLSDTVAATTIAGSSSDNDAQKPKVGKAKAKRAKKAAQKDAATHAQKCGVCNEEFPSKTKLFAHINEEGHAVPVSSVPSDTKGRKKRKGK